MNKVKNGIIWFLKSFLWLIPLLFVIDLTSKLGMEKLLTNNTIEVIPNFFYLDLVYNDGAAWGIFAGQDWLLVTLSCVAGLAMIGYLVWKYKKMPKYMVIALCLMIPGCFGNLVDRAFYPHGVIDFLSFRFGSYHFPNFNVADSCLVIGIFILLIGMVVFDYLEKRKKAKEAINTSQEEEIISEIKDLESEVEDEDDNS